MNNSNRIKSEGVRNNFRTTHGSDLGESQKALQCFEKAIELDPKYASAWYNKGMALKSLGRATEADETFAEAKELGYTS